MNVSKVFIIILYIIIVLMLIDFGLQLISDANIINNVLGVLLLAFILCLPSIIKAIIGEINNIINKK